MDNGKRVVATDLNDMVKYTRLARGIQNPAGSHPNGPWEDFYACDDVMCALAAPQQHAQALPKWIDDQKGKDPLIDSLIAYIEGHPAQQHAQARQIDPIAEMLVRAGEVPKDAERMAEDGRAQAALSDEPVAYEIIEDEGQAGGPEKLRTAFEGIRPKEENFAPGRLRSIRPLFYGDAASKQPAAAPSDGKLPPPADGERSMFEREMLRLDICDDEYMIRRHDGSYVDDCDQAAWMAWQAGRLVSETRSIIIKSDEFLVTFKPKDVTEVVWKGPCISPVAPDGESWQHKCEETERALQYWKAKATQLEVTPVAATPPTPPQEAAALADTDQVPYLIVYDDVDQPAEPVIGGTRARYRFKQISASWNAHLYVKIASNSRDERYPSAALAAPAAQVAVPEGWHDDLDLIRACVEGYPAAPARNHAMAVIRKLLAAAPAPAQPAPCAYPNCTCIGGTTSTCAKVVRGEALSQPKIDRHTAELVTSFEQGRAAGLEEAGNCVQKFALNQLDPDRLNAAFQCLDLIRALNKQEPTA